MDQPSNSPRTASRFDSETRSTPRAESRGNVEGPLVSFVILTFNRVEQVCRAIRSALTQRYANREIIVVNNDAPSEAAEVLRQRFPDIKVVVTGENLGSAGGRDRGIAAAAGDYLIFLDDDCVLAEDDAAASVVAQFEGDPLCGAIAFRIYDPLTQDRTYDLSGLQGSHAVGETVRFCSGGFAARRQALERTGGFFEPYFMEHVDTDLSLRLLNDGWRIIIRGDISVYHPSRQAHGSRNLRREVYLHVRNSIWLALRLLPVTRWFTLLLPTLLRTFLLAFRLGGLRLFACALLDGFRRTRRCVAERRPISRKVLRRARRLGIRIWM